MTLVLQVALVIIVVAGVVAFVVYGGRVLVWFTHPDDPTHRPGAQVLRYHLDVGLEPAAVLDEVWHAGYHATTEYRSGQVDLLVAWAGDPVVEREKVRAAIAGAPDRQGLHGGMPPPVVRFADETPSPR